MTGPAGGTDWRQRVWRWLDCLMAFLALAALVSLVLEYGWYLPQQYHYLLQTVDIIIISLFIAETFVKLGLARSRRQHVRQNALHFVVVALVAVQLLVIWVLSGSARLGTVSPAKLFIVAIQIGIVLRLAVQAMEAQKYLAKTRVRPALVVVGSFLGIVAIGAALLYSPRAVPLGREHMPLVDAFFTATSAVCVTGLVVRDTGTDYGLFGQGVILALIQIGGLGLMTFSAFFALALGGGLRLTERLMMKDVIRHDLLGEVGRALTAILVITFVCEAVGAALLYGVWHGTMSAGERLYYSVFHSISAFCNAGFALYSNNFEEYTGDLRLNVVICALIVVGGIGFVVQSNLLRVLGLRAVRLFRPHDRFRPPHIVPTYLSIQTRIVLVTTAALIVVGATGVFLLEWNGQLSAPAMTLGTKVEASFFQSITARTAGFNTLKIGQLSLATLVLLGMLMFIGASPGGTGGGIKTSTFAMLVLTVRAQMRGRDQVEAFHRTIPRDIIGRVVVVVTLATMVVAAAVLALTITERGGAYLQQQQNGFIQLLFETLSAFGTVGLSTGLTPYLTTAGKIVIMLTMFLGRVGPLTVFVLLGSRALRTGYSYPEEQVLVG